MSASIRNSSCSDHTPEKIYAHQISRSVEGRERREQTRKRKKWKQNLAVFTSEEEGLSSDSDTRIQITTIFENNEMLALRFPYPMISDDSDNNEDFHCPRDNITINRCGKTDFPSNNNNTKPSIVESESYKHKKRKTENSTNYKGIQAHNSKEIKYKKNESSALLTRKPKEVSNCGEIVTNKKIRLEECAYRKSSQNVKKKLPVSNESDSSSLVTKRQKGDIKTNKGDTIAKSQVVSKIEKNSRHCTTERQVSNLNNLDKTSSHKKSKKVGQRNSRFLDSSSEEEVFTKKSVRHKKFKRIHLLSNSPSSSDNEETTQMQGKRKRTKLLSTSSSGSDNEELGSKTLNRSTHLLSSTSNSDEEIPLKKIKDGNAEQDSKLGLTQLKPNVSKKKSENYHAHSMSSSNSDEDYNNAKSFHTADKDKNCDFPVKEDNPLCSSKQSYSELPSKQKRQKSSENQINTKYDYQFSNNRKETKTINSSPSKCNLNTNMWKSIANVQLKRPKSSSTHQSYVKTLKKQFLASHDPSIEINKKINDKCFITKGYSEPNKESYLQSKVFTESPSMTSSSCSDSSKPLQKHTDKTICAVTEKRQEQQIDLNFNVNLQINCSPNIGQHSNHEDDFIAKSLTETNDETMPQNLGISLKLTNQPNNKIKLSCFDEGINLSKSKNTELLQKKDTTTHNDQSRSQLKHNEPEKIIKTPLYQNNDQSESQAKQNEQQKIKDSTITQNKKKYFPKNEKLKIKMKNTIQREIENKISTVIEEKNVGGTDVLTNILFEMDNNPFRVQKNKKPPEITAEMLGWGSSIPEFHSASQTQVRLQEDLQSSEKENESLIHKTQLGNKLSCSKQTSHALVSSFNSHSDDQTSQPISNLKPNKSVEQTKQNENVPVIEQKDSLKDNEESFSPVITSFYSVNLEDYNRPKKISGNKSNDNGRNSLQNISVQSDILENGNKTNDFHKETRNVEAEQLFLEASKGMPTTIPNPSSIQESEEENGCDEADETCSRPYLADRISAPPVRNLKPNKSAEQSKQNENLPLIEQRKSSEDNEIPVTPVITSFYSVNLEDYNRPKKKSWNKSNYNGRSSLQNTSHQANVLENSNEIALGEDLFKNNHLLKETRTVEEVEQLSLRASKRMPTTIPNPSSIQESEDENSCTEADESDCRPSLANRISAERNLKDVVYVQGVIDELTKGIARKNPSVSEKVLSNEDPVLFSKKSNPKSGNTALIFSEESTSPTKIYSKNYSALNDKELSTNLKNPMKEPAKGISFSEESTLSKKMNSKNDSVLNDKELSKNLENAMKEPAKGIRIRLGGNIYRLSGKVNLSNKNMSVTNEKEIIPNTESGTKTQPVCHIPPNNVVTGNLSTSSISSKESSSDSSSSDSSDESESSDSDEEDRLVVSEKSCETNVGSLPVNEKEVIVFPENSSPKSMPGDKKEKAVQSIKESKEISKVTKVVSTNSNSVHKESRTESMNTASHSLESKIIKEGIKSFNLDEMLGLRERNEMTANNTSNEISEEEISNSNNTIVISSSGESDTNEDKDQTSKLRDLAKNSVKSSSIQKSEQIYDSNNKKLDIGGIQSNSKEVVQEKIGKIRVRSLEELGIVNACPLPDNALMQSRLESTEINDNQNPQALSLHADESNPAGLLTTDKVNKKSRPKQSKKTAQIIKIRKNCKLRDEANEPKNVQMYSVINKTTASVPKINIVLKDAVVNKKAGNIIPLQSKHSVKSTEMTNKLVLNKSNAQQHASFQNQMKVLNPKKIVVLDPAVLKVSCNVPMTASNLNLTSVESSSDQSSSGQSSSCSVTKHQNQNQPQTAKEGVDQTENTKTTSELSKKETLFFKLCDDLFTEVVLLKIPKLVDDLHLVITHDIMREERLKKIDQLKCSDTKEEEKRRTAKEFSDMLKVRGQGFVPLFMTIVRKMDKYSTKTLILALYCKIIHQLEQIDPNNCSYRFRLRILIKTMLVKHHIDAVICSVFDEKITSFISNFHFIEALLLKYDEFAAKRKQLHSSLIGTSDVLPNDIDQTEQLRQSTLSESMSNEVGGTNSTNTEVSAPHAASTVVQNQEKNIESNATNLLIQPSAVSNTQKVPPVGNLDQILFGSSSSLSKKI